MDLPSDDCKNFLEAIYKAKCIPKTKTSDHSDLTVAEFLDFFAYDTTGNSNQSEIPREPVKIFMKIADDSDSLEKLGERVLFILHMEFEIWKFHEHKCAEFQHDWNRN